MRNDLRQNAGWAQENRHEFHAVSEGALYEEARGLKVFRRAEGFREHVVGTHRDRPFEVLDIRELKSFDGASGYVWKTVVLVPVEGLELPDFDLWPRRETRGMGLLGMKGLDLNLAPGASADEHALVDAFNRNYSLFAGGAFDAVGAAIKPADYRVPSPADLAPVCKPGALKLLSTSVTGIIEVRQGFLAIQAPEMQAIAGSLRDVIVEGTERESLLNVANDLLDALAKAPHEPALRSLQLVNTFNPRQVLGSVIGGLVGFGLGGFLGILSLFLFDAAIYLIPLLAFVLCALGGFVGKRLTR